jgi:hypothetical protein
MAGINVQQNDVFRVVQALAAGANVVTHNLGFSPVTVTVLNNTTGAIVTHQVTAESTASVTINVAVAVASARISIDA